MESLRFEPPDLHIRSAAPLGRPSRDARPRLPTPDASQSSDENHHDGSSPNKRRRIDEYLQYSIRSDVIAPLDVSRQKYRSRRDSGVHSPARTSADLQKPSLPSLSTILNGEQLSPPKTPSPQHALREPSPREPSFTSSSTDTLPLSLYPTRAPRIDTLASSRALDVKYPQPAARSNILEPRIDVPTFHASIALPPLAANFEHREPRRAALPPFSVSHGPPSPCWSRRYPSPAHPAHPAKQPDNRCTTDLHITHRTPDLTPISSTTSRASSFVGSIPEGYRTYPEEGRDNLLHREFVEHSVPRSMHPPCQGGCQPYLHSRDLSDRHYYGDAVRDCRERSHRGVFEEQQHQPMGLPVSYPPLHSPGSFFVPNHFDFQHGKSRKRSNLPKQSTEIMKQWFDQNLSNPYPSEEQKQHFSSVTGISMTQVSNWFINHRRRCPELRDKREKCRGREEDI